MTASRQNQIMLHILGAVFFLSGMAALIYQVSWQRLLFAGVGVDLTSITVIISVFMVGLGIGAYFGGRIADCFPTKILLIFCTFELSIGIFGLFSYPLILWIGEVLSHASMGQVALLNFIVLLLPTFLMGTTLPLLTFFFNQYIENIGESIGTLYFCNTIGAAAGSYLCGFVFYNHFTLSQTILFAAAFNFATAVVAFLLYGRKS